MQSIQRYRMFIKTCGVFLVLMLGLSACASSQSQATAPAQPTSPPPATSVPQIPEISIQIDSKGFKVDKQVPGGIVKISIQNTDQVSHTTSLWRIRQGKTQADVLHMNEMVKQNPDAFLGVFEIGSWIHNANVESLPPGATYSFYADLKTGEFFVMQDENPDLITFFSAPTIVGTVEPSTNLKLDMLDFAYTMPDTVSAGKQLWQIANNGKQWHLAAIATHNPNLPPEAILSAFGDANSPPPADAPVKVIGGMPPMSENERIWMEFDLAAGTYDFVCPLPDVSAIAQGGEPVSHLLKGMRRTFTVK